MAEPETVWVPKDELEVGMKVGPTSTIEEILRPEVGFKVVVTGGHTWDVIDGLRVAVRDCPRCGNSCTGWMCNRCGVDLGDLT